MNDPASLLALESLRATVIARMHAVLAPDMVAGHDLADQAAYGRYRHLDRPDNPNGYLKAVLEHRDLRPDAVNAQLDAFALGLLLAGKLSEPDLVARFVPRVANCSVPLDGARLWVEKYGLDKLAKEISRARLPLLPLLDKNHTWLGSVVVLDLLLKYELVIPQKASTVDASTKSDFAQQLSLPLRNGMRTYLETIDLDAQLRATIATLCQDRLGQSAVPAQLIAALGAALKLNLPASRHVHAVLEAERQANKTCRTIHVHDPRTGEDEEDIIEVLPLRRALEEVDEGQALLRPLKVLLARHLPGQKASKLSALASELQSIDVASMAEQQVRHELPLTGDLSGALAAGITAQRAGRFKAFASGPETMPGNPALQATQGYAEWLDRIIVECTDTQLAIAARHASNGSLDQTWAAEIARIAEGGRTGQVLPAQMLATLKNLLAAPGQSQRSAAQKTEALILTLGKYPQVLNGQNKENLAAELAKLDEKQIRALAAQQALGIGDQAWHRFGGKLAKVFEDWKNWGAHFDEHAMQGHLRLQKALIKTAGAMCSNLNFEQFFLTALPYLSIADVRWQLSEQSHGLTPWFVEKLEAVDAYYASMEQMFMVDEDDEKLPLKLMPCNIDGLPTSFLAVSNLLMLNKDNHEYEQTLNQFHVIGLDNGVPTSTALRAPVFQNLQLPDYLRTALTKNFTAANILARHIYQFVSTSLETGGIVLSGDHKAILEKAIFFQAAFPGWNFEASVAEKRDLLNQMNDGNYSVIATDLFPDFGKQSRIPPGVELAKAKKMPPLHEDQRQINLARVIVAHEKFKERMSPALLDGIENRIDGMTARCQQDLKPGSEIPLRHEVAYLFSMLFADLSSIAGLGYENRDGDEEGHGGNANNSVSLFRLLSGYCLALSLTDVDAHFDSHEYSNALKSLDGLMQNDYCSGMIASDLRNGYNSDHIGVRMARLLRQQI